MYTLYIFHIKDKLDIRQIINRATNTFILYLDLLYMRVFRYIYITRIMHQKAKHSHAHNSQLIYRV